MDGGLPGWRWRVPGSCICDRAAATGAPSPGRRSSWWPGRRPGSSLWSPSSVCPSNRGPPLPCVSIWNVLATENQGPEIGTARWLVVRGSTNQSRGAVERMERASRGRSGERGGDAGDGWKDGRRRRRGGGGGRRRGYLHKWPMGTDDEVGFAVLVDESWWGLEPLPLTVFGLKAVRNQPGSARLQHCSRQVSFLFLNLFTPHFLISHLFFLSFVSLGPQLGWWSWVQHRQLLFQTPCVCIDFFFIADRKPILIFRRDDR